MVMKLEYLGLIILAYGFYEAAIKDAVKAKKNRDFVANNLEVGSKITTFSGIIGQVLMIDGDRVDIVTGTIDKHSYLTIKKSQIKNIIG